MSRVDYSRKNTEKKIRRFGSNFYSITYVIRLWINYPVVLHNPAFFGVKIEKTWSSIEVLHKYMVLWRLH